MQKIDAHVHLGDWRKWGLRLDLEELEEIRAQYEVSHAVILPVIHGPHYGPGENLRTLERVACNPAYLFFYWVHPSPDLSNLDQAFRVIEENRRFIRGLKFHPSVSQRRIDAPEMRPLLELAAKYSLPVLVHSGRSDISDARYVRTVALQFPSVNFIIAHLGGQAYDRIMDMMEFYATAGIPANVYWDTSQSAHSVLLRRAVDRLEVDRLLFGVDLPFKEYWAAVHTIESIGLSEAQKDAIYRSNFAQLFNLSC